MNGCTHDCNQGRRCTCRDPMKSEQRHEIHELRRYEVRGGFVYDRKQKRLATSDECRAALEAISNMRAMSAGLDFSQIDRGTDDHGRRDLTGGLGYALIGAVAFWLGLAGWILWRVI